ncbi:acyltransferase family protein [Ktedonobacter racemifer]|uniref:Acyltransferase 3 n=1 Tax=Ktedonobacter racemifer DSM 44963 TaxID=485913 RepID=D6U4E0_KTERA|nr:acyltransferase family protein [Ktedonobacter racemifer]EFH81370.1 acyltransferase 3 [Ktedonobacter racemifer DSM 44963]
MSTQIDQETSNTLEAPLASEATARPRLFFVDHTRIFLTTLVIIHHLALTYIAGPWYYRETTYDLLTNLLLGLLVLFNQSFFMGCFFLISGYFTPGSYNRKGPKAFLRDRFLRLGLPLLIFTFILNPLIIYLGAGTPMPYGSFLLKYGVSTIGTGPLWFVEALLVFDCLYVFWRWLTRKRTTSTPATAISKPLTYRAILAFILSLALITFLVRLWLPFGWTVPLVNLIPSNFPQYIGLFLIGLLATRHGWFQNIPTSMGKIGLGVALGSTLILFLPALLSGWGTFAGGLHWQAFVYALWEALMGVGMSMGLLVFFRQRMNRQGNLGKLLSRQAYAVYIIHALILVCVAEYALGSLHLYPLLKFALAMLISIPLCLVCAYLLRKLPLARKIL